MLLEPEETPYDDDDENAENDGDEGALENGAQSETSMHAIFVGVFCPNTRIEMFSTGRCQFCFNNNM